MIISKKDFERNIDNLNLGKSLDVSLKSLKDYIHSKKLKESKKCFGAIQDIIKQIHIPKILEKKICSICDKEFQATTKNQKACSPECRRKRLNELACNNFKKRKDSDWQFALKIRLRDNLKDAIRYYDKTGLLRKHKNSGRYINYPKVIKSLGPCPGNRREWHIDHITPLCLFDFSKTSEITKAFDINNLRWLSAKENLKKNKRFEMFCLTK